MKESDQVNGREHMIAKLGNKKYQVVKYDKRKQGIICECGGQALVGGEAIYKTPVGVGFHPDGKFYSDYIQYKGWFGQCLKCCKRIFAYKSKRAVSQRIKV